MKTFGFLSRVVTVCCAGLQGKEESGGLWDNRRGRQKVDAADGRVSRETQADMSTPIWHLVLPHFSRPLMLARHL